MNADVLVSVVLPTYNRKHIIGRAISSVLQQTHENFELIIVDDGSTDETCRFVTSDIDDDRIKYIYQPNRGVSAARNTGLANAHGSNIAFIDSDDEWDETKIEKQLAFFQEHSEVGLVFCDISMVSQNGTVSDITQIIPRTRNRIFTLRGIFLDPYLGMPTVMLKRELIDVIGGFDENLSSAEDVDLFLKAALKTDIGYLHDKLVFIHNTLGSLSSNTLDSDKINSYENNIFVIKRFVNEHRMICDEVGCDISGTMFGLYCDYGRSLLSRKRKVASREKFLLAHKYKINIESLYLLMKTYLPGDL